MGCCPSPGVVGHLFDRMCLGRAIVEIKFELAVPLKRRLAIREVDLVGVAFYVIH